MKQPEYKAVVYDVDGTAVDSRYNIDALQETCIELLGREATDEELKITYGMTAKNAILYLGGTEDQVEPFEKRWIEKIMKMCQNASLFDGIYDGMCQMKDAGILLGINTSRNRNELGDLHEYIKEPFLELCSLIVTCDKVANPKPAPDSLLYFLRETGLKPSEVLFVGDSEFDAGCAKMPVVTLHWLPGDASILTKLTQPTNRSIRMNCYPLLVSVNQNSLYSKQGVFFFLNLFLEHAIKHFPQKLFR